MAYEIGDRIRVLTTDNCSTCNCSGCDVADIGKEFVITNIVPGNHGSYAGYFWEGWSHGSSHHVCGHDGQAELVNKSNKSFMKNLIEKSRLLAKSEPEKSLIKKGITDISDVLTVEGKQLFDDFLYRSNKAAFVADPAVAALLAEKDENKE